LLSLLLLSVVAVLGPTSPALAQSVPSPNPVTSPDQVEGATWAVTLGPAPLRSQPDDNSEQFSELRPGSPVQILGYADTWAFVFNPRAGQQGTAYVHSDLLGPSDPPSAYVFKTPPADQDSVDQTGQLTADTPLAVYPSPDPAAELSQLDQGTWVTISATVEGDDGAQWYRTDDGNFLPRDAVALGPQPSAPTVAAAPTPPTQTYQGRWLDVDLTEPAHITAYQDNTPARTMLTIKGRIPRPTPVGQFTILRRVVNETMDSSTIGVPRNGSGGYCLKNVLFTQYFTNDGASLHYNYWSSNFGYAGSHSCLGLSYADSAWLWNWATVGTPLSIHY
jgi:lipoprotein-anchoring transpeptidase ErfK/SrfK